MLADAQAGFYRHYAFLPKRLYYGDKLFGKIFMRNGDVYNGEALVIDRMALVSGTNSMPYPLLGQIIWDERQFRILDLRKDIKLSKS